MASSSSRDIFEDLDRAAADADWSEHRSETRRVMKAAEDFIRRSQSRGRSPSVPSTEGRDSPVPRFWETEESIPIPRPGQRRLQVGRKGKRGGPTLKEVNRVLGNLKTDIDTGSKIVTTLREDLKSAHRPQPHIGLGGVHHNTHQAPVSDSGPPGRGLLPRTELREPHPVTQGTYKIYDHANPPKRSDFLEQALFGSVQVTPRLGFQSEWQRMPGYEATPVPPPSSSKTPFGKYVEPRRPVVAFALSPSGPVQGSDEPGLAALPDAQTPAVDWTKKFSVIGH